MKCSAHNLKATFLMAGVIVSGSVQVQADVPVTQTKMSAIEDEIRWIHEEQFVSTATKSREKISKSGSSVSIVSKQDFINMGARNLMDALKRLPGFSVQETFIGIPAIEVRGSLSSDSEKVLFMIDGHSVNNNLVNGGATWAYNNFPIDEIKRVEIVRGPGSALYGANAFVAVINIITETADDIKGLEVTLGSESDSTRKANIQFGADLDNIKFSANLNMLESNGTTQYVKNDGVGRSGNTVDWQKRYDFSFNLQTNNLTLQGKYIDRRAGPFIGIGNALNDETVQDYTEYFLDLSYEKALSSPVNFIGRIYTDQFKTKNYWEILPEGVLMTFPDGLLGSPTVKNQKTGAETQLDIQVGNTNKVLMGLLFEHQTQFDVQHKTNFDPNTLPPTALPSYMDISDTGNWNSSQNRDISAFYFQDIWDITEQLRLIAGYRYDHYSDFGKSNNPRASITWEFIDNFNISAAYGKAFRAPSFGELYNINNPSIVGNENLNPEKIETFEVSVNGQLNRRNHFKLTSFLNKINNLIEKDSANQFQNTGKLSVNGVELEFSSRLLNGSSFNANYTYQFAENESANVLQPHVAMHKANLGFNYRHSQFVNAYIGALYSGKLRAKEGDTYDSDSLKEKVSVDASVNFSNKSDTLNLGASIYNIFDADNSVPSGDIGTGRHYAIPEQDRHIALSLSYKL